MTSFISAIRDIRPGKRLNHRDSKSLMFEAAFLGLDYNGTG